MFVEHKPLTLPTLPAPRTVGELLLMAARFIEEHGWSPTGHEMSQDRYCPIEAICKVTRPEEQQIRDEAYRLLRDQIGKMVGITRWNERSTEDEVVATMRQAARRTNDE
jgi:hypothetical protein